MSAILSMRGIVKRFPGVTANDGVDFDLRAGEVHALLGENGAGKSTLMNILCGLHPPDAGEVLLSGQPVRLRSPRDAISHGIGMVHQHFMLVPTLSVVENVVLGLSRPRLLLQLDRAAARLKELCQAYGMALDPHAPVWQLSVGEQQRVEILKALYRGARILILDEPTAVLSPRESAALRAALRQMAGRGQAVIFISHKLDEVLQVADRITVLRRGRVTAAGLAAAQATRASLAEEMVGRPVLLDLDRPPAAPGDPVLEVQDLCARGDRGGDAVRGVSLRVRAGEIYGLAGVAGNGQRELMEVLTGLRPAARGQVRLAGRDVTAAPPAVRLDLGLAHVPEDRGGLGSVPALSVADNLVLRAYRREGALLDRRRLGQTVQDLRAAFALAAPPEAPAGTLSGGSLQRLILARELSARPRLLIAHCPCRGLDVAASETVYRWLLQARAQGTAILLISEDLDELLSLSDRIGVMSGGALRGELAAAGASSGELGLLIGAG